MKRFLFFFLLAYSKFIYGNFNFPDSSASWTILYIGWGNCNGVQTLSITGDTTIDNTTYKIIRSSYDSVFNLSKSNYLCSVKDTANKWYFYFNGNSKKLLLYDFNLVVGDSLSVNNFNGETVKIKVLAVDTVLINGLKRRRLKISPYNNITGPSKEYWIEGIGSVSGLIYSSKYTIDYGWDLICFSQDNKLNYNTKANCACFKNIAISTITSPNLTISPNPFNEITTIKFLEDFEDYVLYNNYGEVIKSGLISRNENSLNLDLRNSVDGLYFLKLTTKNYTNSIKLIKLKH